MVRAGLSALPTTRSGKRGRPSGCWQRRPIHVLRRVPRRNPTSSKKKLSYLEAREYASIEERVAAAEHVLEAKRVAAGDPSIASDATRLMNAHMELDQAQHVVDELYARWAELEKKQA